MGSCSIFDMRSSRLGSRYRAAGATPSWKMLPICRLQLLGIDERTTPTQEVQSSAKVRARLVHNHDGSTTQDLHVIQVIERRRRDGRGLQGLLSRTRWDMELRGDCSRMS